MNNFLSFVYKQNIALLTIIFILYLILWSYISFRLFNRSIRLIRAINGICSILMLVLILYYTVFSRNFLYDDIQLIPFYSFYIAKSNSEIYRSLFMNILLFIPLGVFMPYFLSGKPNKKNIFITIGFGVFLSVLIEFLQYQFELGRCETDDVLSNTLGATAGTVSYCIYMRLLNNQKKESSMHNKFNDTQRLLFDLCGNTLFDKEIIVPPQIDLSAITKEALKQTVLPLAYIPLKKYSLNNSDTESKFSSILSQNIRVEYAHVEIHELLSKANIKYVILKGVASAAFYKEPLLRTMGDIDILVSSENISKADLLLKSIGYQIINDINSDDKHIEYKRKGGIVCEMHRSVNGVPQNKTRDIVNKYLIDIFNTTVEYKTSNGSCIVPSTFHHGVVLLLHTANHLTNEGVGLRHLCDWAVFVNSLSNDEFVDLFEAPLKDMGLWRFAQLLTICCEKYLGIDKKQWAGEAEESLIGNIIADILTGGNFGYKDKDRYGQIKYISDREANKVSDKGTFSQLLSSINAKAKTEYKFAKKCKLLLPIAWLAVVFNYLILVLTRKRKLDNINTINSAKHRQSLYNEFKLFEKNE